MIVTVHTARRILLKCDIKSSENWIKHLCLMTAAWNCYFQISSTFKKLDQARRCTYQDLLRDHERFIILRNLTDNP